MVVQGLLEVLHVAVHDAQVPVGLGDQDGVVQLLGQRQLVLVAVHCVLVLAHGVVGGAHVGVHVALACEV